MLIIRKKIITSQVVSNSALTKMSLVNLRHFLKHVVCLLGLLMVSVNFIQSANAATDMSKEEFWDDHEPTSRLTVNHSRWGEILETYLDTQHPSGINRFNYSAVSSQDTAKLDGYLSYMQSLEPRQMNKAEQMAYWINLYNATAVKFVIEYDPDDSVLDIRSGVFSAGGPWSIKVLNIAGQTLTLDTIEHGILRPIWSDPRIHFVLNCASLGCPNLAEQPYTSSNLDDMLEQAARDFINHPRGVRTNGAELELSSIFDWYDTDFAPGLTQMKEYLSKYAEPDLAEQIESTRTVSYQYDWSLNKP